MIKSIKLDNGKEYRLFTSRMEVEVKTSRIHTETGYPIWMRVNGVRVIAQVISAIADADHAEALEMTAAIEWAKITPEQRAIHEARVIFGISLKDKHNTDDVFEACHAEALEEEKRYACAWLALASYPSFTQLDNEIQRRRALEAAYAEALDMEAARNLNARQARFVFHNTAAERAEAIEAAHAEALKINIR
jgi:predicted O-linked N-acetylglucosamine transferase (SPINDLY family)